MGLVTASGLNNKWNIWCVLFVDDSILDSNHLKVSVFLLARYPCFYINNCNRLNRIEIWFYWLIILVLISHDWFRDGFKPIESEFGFIGSLSLLCHQLSAMWWQFVRGVKVARDMLLMHGHALQQENEPLKEYQDNLFQFLPRHYMVVLVEKLESWKESLESGLLDKCLPSGWSFLIWSQSASS